MYIVDSTSHRINRRLHQTFEDFNDAKEFFNKVSRRSRSHIYLWEDQNGEIIAIKNSLQSELPNYYSATYKEMLKR